MSEEAVKYETGEEVTYKTREDLLKEFLERTGVDYDRICDIRHIPYTDTMSIELKSGGKLVYISE